MNEWINQIEADMSLIAALRYNVEEKEKILFAVIAENEVLKEDNKSLTRQLQDIVGEGL